MPKPKQFLKDDHRKKKASKHTPQLPETADEYLAAGVDHEEAGEKWRGGDAAKSTRFFLRAIDTYDEGLKKFPHSFDLAYNKARVQYEITQHPKLRGQLPGTMLDLLSVALESSRRALALKQDDPDVLFNTAQVLTSLAESLDDANSSPEPLIPLLEEAIELFQRCLTLQEYRLAESESQALASANIDIDTEDGGVSLSPSPNAIEQEQWASIIEPITPSSLLDTLLATLETLTLLCTKTTPSTSRTLSWLEEYTTTLLHKLPLYLTSLPTRTPEASLTRANFLAALADANFRAHLTDFSTYERALYDAYRALDLASDPKGLSDKADAMLVFAASLRTQPTPENLPQQIVARWGALTQAGAALAAASKLPGAENLARIHLARGDAEMARWMLRSVTGYPGSVEAEVLRRNAGVFYRGAAKQAGVEGEGEAGRVGMEARVKNAMVAALGGEGAELREMLEREPGMTREVLEEAVGEGLVEVEALQRVGVA